MSEGVDSRGALPDMEDVSNALVLSPVAGGLGRNLSLDVLGQSPSGTHALAITYSARAERWIEAWDERVGESPASGGIVAVGQPTTEFESESWAVRTVASPEDLTGIGIASSELLSQMAANASPSEDVVVGFDSVTALLQHTDLQRAFRFLHVVTGRVRNADARCYYHLDNGAHEKRALVTLEGLFEATIEHGDSGWMVRR